MTKQTYWLSDDEGTQLAVEGADRRDEMVQAGWTETTEATGDEFVWVRHPDVAGDARIPAASLEVWQVRGWEIGIAPAGPALEEEPPAVPTPAATKPDSKPKPAAGGDTKEH
jgi:hypothetical protein